MRDGFNPLAFQTVAPPICAKQERSSLVSSPSPIRRGTLRAN
jgi:hypothetical protein